jgi:hypothetical protein
MNGRRVTAGVAVAAALVVAGVALVASEVVQGSNERSTAIADPCAQRAAFPGSGVDAAVQRVVLDGLDGAACQLGTSRERLVLALAGDSSQRLPNDQTTIDSAVRAGLLRALDEASNRGDVPALLVPLLRRIVQTTPLDELIRGAVGLRGLFG